MVSTALSSISCCKASIFTSTAETRCANAVSRFASASTESATCFSARPPISATMRARSCRSESKAFIVWSDIVVIVRSLSLWPNHLSVRNQALAETAGDVILGAVIGRTGEDTGGFPELDQLAEIHESREVGDACGLLHIVGHDRNCVIVLEFVDQFLALRRFEL